MKTRTKIIALMMAVLMLASLLPIASLAAETTAGPSASPQATEQSSDGNGEASDEATHTASDDTPAEPPEEPTADPTTEPTSEPTSEPTGEPTAEPTQEPAAEPTTEPTAEPTEETPPISTELVTERKDYSFKKFGLQIGDTYIPLVQPSANEDNGISLMSLLPMEEKYLDPVDLSGYLPSQLKAVKLDVVWPEGTPTGQIAWSKDGDKFQILEAGGTMDLTPPSFASSILTLTIISGPDPKDQLNPENVKYHLTVNLPTVEDVLSFTILDADGNELPFTKTVHYYSGDVQFDYYLSLDSVESYDQVKTLRFSTDPSNKVGATLTNLWYGEYDTEGSSEVVPSFECEVDPLEIRLFTAEITKDGATDKFTFCVYFSFKMPDSPKPGESDYTLTMRGIFDEGVNVTDYYSTNYGDNGVRERVYSAKRGYPADKSYSFRMDISGISGMNDPSLAEKAVVGLYASLADAEKEPDIKEQLFGEGYSANYSGDGVEFTIFTKSGTVEQFRIKLDPYVPSGGTYFYISGVSMEDSDPGSKTSCFYQVNNDTGNDAMGNAYQTVYIMTYDYEPIPERTKIYPFFESGYATVYRGENAESGIKQESGESAIEFENGMVVEYSVSSEDGKNTQNYFVTFVTPSTSAKLHVPGDNVHDNNFDETEGVPKREIHLGDMEYLETHYYSYDVSDIYYDILVTNDGGVPLTGLKAYLEDAQNVQLDPYWSFTEDGTGTLGPINKDSMTDEYGYTRFSNLANQAKIRLLPLYDANGEIVHGTISGYLVITSDNGGTVRIKLSGIAGLPKITTETIVPGVKYVPYDTLIQTNNVGPSDAVTFEIYPAGMESEIALPTGVEWHENGELYGVPLESGTYEFDVFLYVNDATQSLLDYKTFSLTITENTDDNVWGASDNGYSVLNYIGIPGAGTGGPLDGTEHYILTGYTDQMFRSEGEYQYFEDFYLDGRKLTEGVDYNSSSGSTRITILEQTLRGAGEGTHTIAAEFHEMESSTGLPMGSLRRTSQNYTVDLSAKIRNDVDIVVKVQNTQGDPLSDYQVVLHSTPKYGTTNQYGAANFLYVEYGGHTLTVTDTKGSGASASKEFTLVSGRSTSLSGNTVTAKPGSAITLTVRMDGTDLKLLSAETSVPLTGDQTDFGKYATISALSGLMAVVCVAGLFWQKDKRRGKHARC